MNRHLYQNHRSRVPYRTVYHRIMVQMRGEAALQTPLRLYPLTMLLWKSFASVFHNDKQCRKTCLPIRHPLSTQILHVVTVCAAGWTGLMLSSFVLRAVPYHRKMNLGKTSKAEDKMSPNNTNVLPDFTQSSQTQSQTLPDEILVRIATACVDPWTLIVKRAEGTATVDRRDRPILEGMPNTSNVQRANTLFHDEVKLALLAKFDGHILIDHSKVNPDRLLDPHGNATWLAPHITHITVQSDHLSHGINPTLYTLPNLTELILNLQEVHEIAAPEAFPDNPEKLVGESNVISECDDFLTLNLFVVGFETMRIVRALLDRQVIVKLRLRFTSDGWMPAIIMLWKLSDAQNSGVQSSFGITRTFPSYSLEV